MEKLRWIDNMHARAHTWVCVCLYGFWAGAGGGVGGRGRDLELEILFLIIPGQLAKNLGVKSMSGSRIKIQMKTQ